MADAGLSEAGLDPIGPGRLVLVVGPSGAGKDSVIGGVCAALETGGTTDVIFPTRIVTRSAHAAEANASISPEDFEIGRARGAFALSWQAHGLGYAIPSEIDHDIRAGRMVVINTSRAVVAAARIRYRSVTVMLIDAPVAIRAERLAARGREARADIEARLKPAVSSFGAGDADVVIENGGKLNDAVNAAVSALNAICGFRRPKR